MMKIGIDLDDVIFEFTKTFLNLYSQKYNNSVRFEDVKTYHFPEVLNIPLREVIALIEEMFFKGLTESMPLCNGARESILALADNHDILFLTSRVFRNGTLESLKKLFPEIKFKLIYASNIYAKTEGKTKGDLCIEEGVDLMIEDSKEYAKEITALGIKTILLDRPWNQDLQHENLVRVYDWKEVLNQINNKNGIQP